MSKTVLDPNYDFYLELNKLLDEYKEVLKEWRRSQKSALLGEKLHYQMQAELQSKVGGYTNRIKELQVKLLQYYPEEEVMKLGRMSALQAFLRDKDVGIIQGLPVIQELRSVFSVLNDALHEINYAERKLDDTRKASEELRLRAKEIETKLQNHLEKQDGVIVNRDGKLVVLEYKAKKLEGGLIQIQESLKPFTGKKSDIEVSSIDGYEKLKAYSNQFKPDEKLYMLTQDVHDAQKETRIIKRQQSSSDKAYKKYLETKSNIPPTQFVLPKYQLNIKSPRIRNAVGRLQNESLIGRKFEFVWIPKKKNKRHAQEMLAVRYGINHSSRTIDGEVKGQIKDTNKVELYLVNYQKVVECSIEQDEVGKWGISTFFQGRKDWALCENNTPDVPSGLSQELNMNYTLEQLVEFHKLIKENYDNQIGLTKKRANG